MAKRTNVVLDEKLVKEAKQHTGAATTREVVDLGLRELVRQGRQKGIRRLRGKVDWVGDLDEMRRSRFEE
ncbi:MAG: hypothetical protein BWX88_03412 [Planctomycetes bacterium ADurb.Bin126]|nr:MAG: hypothetical protein BWX88_03412 [Planctomycetes bacterium ADurb.Bin126]HOD81738.1 type II toxin-antitoxin system VapB family antitoxin [Phycisphaerae bacterium]HQL74720.1 type II toxin-antitoxin system VapB family antitoxin [Phycisphaerae bacterium]